MTVSTPKDNYGMTLPTKTTYELKMPFGQHRGVLVRKLPQDYATWLLKNGKDLAPTLQAALRHRCFRTMFDRPRPASIPRVLFDYCKDHWCA